MDTTMKKRLIGAVVLIALAAIVLPFILKNQGANRNDIANLKLPAEPIYQVPKNMMAGIDKSIEKTSTTIATTSKEIADIDTTKISQGNDDAPEAVPGSIGTTRPQVNATGTLGFRLPTEEEREAVTPPSPAPAPTPTKVASAPSSSSEASSSSRAAEPAPAAPKPKPTPTITDVDNILPGYAVQLISTPISNGAQELKTVFLKEGYTTFIMKFDNNGKMYHRVRIGTYPSKVDAEKVQDELKRRYTKNPYVQSSIVVHHK